MSNKIGMNAVLYRNTGSYGSPTWSAVTLISDLSVKSTWESADASARESRVKQYVKTMYDLEITGKIKCGPTDANYIAIMNAANSDDVLDLLVLDGSKDVEGSRGYRFDAQIFDASQDQSMSNALYNDLTIRPSITTNVVKACLVGAGPTLTFAIPGVAGSTYA